MHRIIVTKIELFRYGIQSDDDRMYCEKDSINQSISQEFIGWFNVTNKLHFNPSIVMKL